MVSDIPDVEQEIVEFSLDNFALLKTIQYQINVELAVADDMGFLVKENGIYTELGGRLRNYRSLLWAYLTLQPT